MSLADRKNFSGKKEGRKVQKVKKHQAQKKRGTVRKQEKRLAKKQGIEFNSLNFNNKYGKL